MAPVQRAGAEVAPWSRCGSASSLRRCWLSREPLVPLKPPLVTKNLSWLSRRSAHAGPCPAACGWLDLEPRGGGGTHTFLLLPPVNLPLPCVGRHGGGCCLARAAVPVCARPQGSPSVRAARWGPGALRLGAFGVKSTGRVPVLPLTPARPCPCRGQPRGCPRFSPPVFRSKELVSAAAGTDGTPVVSQKQHRHAEGKASSVPAACRHLSGCCWGEVPAREGGCPGSTPGTALLSPPAGGGNERARLDAGTVAGAVGTSASPNGTSGCGSGGRGAAPFPFRSKAGFEPSGLSRGCGAARGSAGRPPVQGQEWLRGSGAVLEVTLSCSSRPPRMTR